MMKTPILGMMVCLISIGSCGPTVTRTSPVKNVVSRDWFHGNRVDAVYFATQRSAAPYPNAGGQFPVGPGDRFLSVIGCKNELSDPKSRATFSQRQYVDQFPLAPKGQPWVEDCQVLLNDPESPKYLSLTAPKEHYDTWHTARLWLAGRYGQFGAMCLAALPAMGLPVFIDSGVFSQLKHFALDWSQPQTQTDFMKTVIAATAMLGLFCFSISGATYYLNPTFRREQKGREAMEMFYNAHDQVMAGVETNPEAKQFLESALEAKKMDQYTAGYNVLLRDTFNGKLNKTFENGWPFPPAFDVPIIHLRHNTQQFFDGIRHLNTQLTIFPKDFIPLGVQRPLDEP